MSIQSDLKFALKNLDLTTATMQDIQNAVERRSPQIYQEVINKTSEIEEVLKSRDISKNLNYDKCYIAAINKNKNSWDTLKKEIKIKGKKGNSLKASLTSVPISQLGIFANLKKGEGISSSDSNIEHAANVWKTEARTTGKDGKDGKVLFSAIRHRNTRGTEMATKEIILAAAVEQYGVEALQKSSKSKIWKVKLGNVQIMSPPKKAISKILSSSDKNKVAEQTDAFKKYFGRPIDMPILDSNGKEKTIKLMLLKDTSLLFNFGSNSIHYSYGGVLVRSSNEQNRESFQKLFGKNILKSLEESFGFNKNIRPKMKPEEKNRILQTKFVDCIDKSSGEVGKCLDKLYKEKEEHPENAKEIDLKVKKIINLSKQILDLWFSTHGRGIKSNPAAIQTRLSALLYLIGYPITFNCKSGKDRTGEVASEINDLVMTMEANDGEVPDPYAELTDKERVQAAKVYDATQSDEIAKANTGFRGLKVGYRKTISRMGQMRGSSKFSNVTSKN